MKEVDLHGLARFLKNYSGMSIAPFRSSSLVLKGRFDFKANVKNGPEIVDSFMLEISVPDDFPKALPKVKETERKIPRDGHHHVNPDETLCLGSPMRLLKKIHAKPTLTGFAEDCLVPYLYAVSHKIMHGGKFIFSDLAHGAPGIIDDYQDLLGLTSRSQVAAAITLLGIKKRLANKRLCPCGCGMRLGTCPFRYKLDVFRKIAHRSWFIAHSKNLGSGM